MFGETAIDLANVSCVLNDGIGLGGDITIIKTQENGVYLSYYLNFKRNEIAKYAQGISIIHLYSKDFKKVELNLPSINEQNKIGGFLSCVDKKLDLLNQQLIKTQDFKKGLMQQIFTQKIRFKEFKDEWEKVQLKYIASVPKKEKIKSIENLKLLTVKLHVKGIEHNDTIIPKLTKKGRPYYQRFHNELLIGRQNFHNGGIGIVPKELDGGICSNAISSFIIDNNIASTKFIFYYLSRRDYYKSAEKLVGGTGQKEFSEKELLKLKLNIPSIEEQNLIADTLSVTDKKIELIDSQISQMEQFKKGLLQQMFI